MFIPLAHIDALIYRHPMRKLLLWGVMARLLWSPSAFAEPEIVVIPDPVYIPGMLDTRNGQYGQSFGMNEGAQMQGVSEASGVPPRVAARSTLIRTRSPRSPANSRRRPKKTD